MPPGCSLSWRDTPVSSNTLESLSTSEHAAERKQKKHKAKRCLNKIVLRQLAIINNNNPIQQRYCKSAK